MFCSNCGKSVQARHRFCSFCGTPLAPADDESARTGQDTHDTSAGTSPADLPGDGEVGGPSGFTEPTPIVARTYGMHSTDDDPDLPAAGSTTASAALASVSPDAPDPTGSPTASGAPASSTASWEVVEQTPMTAPSWSEPPASRGPYAGSGASGAMYDQYARSQTTDYQPSYQPAYQPTYQATTVQPVAAGYAGGYGQRAAPAAYPDAYAAGYDPYAAAPVPPRRVTVLMVMCVLLAAAAIAAMVPQVIATDTDGLLSPFTLKEVAGNYVPVGIVLAIAALAAVVLRAGVRRFGTGLASGVGLAATGWAVMLIGHCVQVLDALEHDAILAGAKQLTKTYDVGFFILCGVAVLGVVVFALGLPGSSFDGLDRYNPLAAVLGVAGTVALAAGPLLPMNAGSWADNVDTNTTPVGSIVARLAVLALVALTGLVGFLNGRRWGLGVAAGGALTGVVLWVTSLIGSDGWVGHGGNGAGGAHLGGSAPGTRTANPGSISLAPHVVTTLGVVGIVLAIGVAVGLDRRRNIA